MERWTIKELRNTDDLSFAIQILNERRKGLNPYAPLYGKISQTVNTLTRIRTEQITQGAAAPEKEDLT